MASRWFFRKSSSATGVGRTGAAPAQVTRDGAFGNVKAEFQELAMDLGRAPGGILLGHAFDGFENVRGQFAAAETRGTRPESPVQPKSSAVPADHSLGFDQDERVAPTIPECVQRHPEQAVATSKMGPRMLAFEHRELLTQGENLQAEIVAGTEEGAQIRQNCEGELGHDRGRRGNSPQVYRRRNSAGSSPSSSVWSFTTMLAAVTLASPTNGASSVTLTPPLSWNGSAGATSYDVYLSTSNPPTAVTANVTTTSYSPATLGYARTYYWKVVAKNANGRRRIRRSGPLQRWLRLRPRSR